MAYTLGVDFGTSSTKVSIRRGKQVPLEIPIGRGSIYMPSVVAYRVGQDTSFPEVMAVGEDADSAGGANIIVVREIKRVFTYEKTDSAVPTDRYPWWNPTDKCVQIGNSKIKPHDVVLVILREALDRAVKWVRDTDFADIGEFDIKGLPAQFGCSVTATLAIRKTLWEIVLSLGVRRFKINDLVEEPVLASMSFINPQATSAYVRPGQIVLIYDLGGGTFDTAIVKVEDVDSEGYPVVTVLAADGEPLCGGVDVDEAVTDYLLERIAEKTSETVEQVRSNLNVEQSQQLHILARESKEALSSVFDTKVTWPLDFPAEYSIDLSISRPQLAAILRRTMLVERTQNCVLRAWRHARMFIRKLGEDVGGFHLMYDRSTGVIKGHVLGLKDTDLIGMVDRILIVGGTTLMPAIREKLEELWGKDKLVSQEVIDPVMACATGAAWQAGRTRRKLSRIIDRLPFSILFDDKTGVPIRLYEAYTPIIRFKPLKGVIEPFKTESFGLRKDSKQAYIIYEAADGKIERSVEFNSEAPEPYRLTVDLFGSISIVDALGGKQILPNPVQHSLQKEQVRLLESVRKQKEEEDRRRTKKYFEEKPGERLHEVG